MSTPSSRVLPSQMTTCGPTKIPYWATSSAGMTLVESVTSAIGATGLLLQHAAGQVGNRPEVSNPPDGPPSRRLSLPFRRHGTAAKSRSGTLAAGPQPGHQRFGRSGVEHRFRPPPPP